MEADAPFPSTQPAPRRESAPHPAHPAAAQSPLPGLDSPDRARLLDFHAGAYKWSQSPYDLIVHDSCTHRETSYFPASRYRANTAPCGSATVATRPTPSKSIGGSKLLAFMSFARWNVL